MITAVDSSVIFDLLLEDPRFFEASKLALQRAQDEGSLVACAVVWAEVCAAFQGSESAAEFFRDVGLEYVDVPAEAALAAGLAWRQYRQHGGTRQRVIGDFLIGAHALHVADRLLTRDRGFYRGYFAGLELLDPTGT